MLFITLVHAYNLSHEREISVGKLILMIILISSRIFRGLFTLLSERTEYHRPRQSPGRLPVAVASHGEFLVLLPWFPIHLLGLAGLHIFSKGRNETLGNGAQVVGCNNNTAVHTAISLQGSMGTLRQSDQPSDRSAAVGSQPAAVPAEQSVLVIYAMRCANDPFCSS